MDGHQGGLSDVEGFALISEASNKNGQYFGGVILEELLVGLLEISKWAKILAGTQQFPGLLSESEARKLSAYASLDEPRAILTTIEMLLDKLIQLSQPLLNLVPDFYSAIESHSMTPEIFWFKGKEWSRFLVDMRNGDQLTSTRVSFVVPLLPFLRTSPQSKSEDSSVDRTLAVVSDLQNIGKFITELCTEVLEFLYFFDSKLNIDQQPLSQNDHRQFRELVQELYSLLNRKELYRLVPASLRRPSR